MSRFLVAGMLVVAGLATLAAPNAEAVCRVDYMYIEDAGASVTCREPNTDFQCYARGPSFWDPVPTIRCAGVEVPPETPVLCTISTDPIGTAYPDTSAHCATANYVEGTDCEARAETSDPTKTDASC